MESCLSGGVAGTRCPTWSCSLDGSEMLGMCTPSDKVVVGGDTRPQGPNADVPLTIVASLPAFLEMIKNPKHQNPFRIKSEMLSTWETLFSTHRSMVSKSLTSSSAQYRQLPWRAMR